MIESSGRKPKREAKDKLSETVIEIEEYNKKHGTNYTYGRYMAAKEHGWLKQDWSEFEDDNKST